MPTPSAPRARQSARRGLALPSSRHISSVRRSGGAIAAPRRRRTAPVAATSNPATMSRPEPRDSRSEAAAIRTPCHQRGELSAAVELRGAVPAFRRREQAAAINSASVAPSKRRLPANRRSACESGLHRDLPLPTTGARERCYRSWCPVRRRSGRHSATPASETSTFSRMRACSNCRAGLVPFCTKVLTRSRSSALSLTMYFLTAVLIRDHDASPNYRRYRFRERPQNQ
jgi:hypothetical protein